MAGYVDPNADPNVAPTRHPEDSEWAYKKYDDGYEVYSVVDEQHIVLATNAMEAEALVKSHNEKVNTRDAARQSSIELLSDFKRWLPRIQSEGVMSEALSTEYTRDIDDVLMLQEGTAILREPNASVPVKHLRQMSAAIMKIWISYRAMAQDLQVSDGSDTMLYSSIVPLARLYRDSVRTETMHRLEQTKQEAAPADETGEG